MRNKIKIIYYIDLLVIILNYFEGVFVARLAARETAEFRVKLPHRHRPLRLAGWQKINKQMVQKQRQHNF